MAEKHGAITIKLGTRATLHGVDVVAADAGVRSYTYGCTFGSLRCPFKDDRRCHDTDCDGIVWLTAPDYVTYRITS